MVSVTSASQSRSSMYIGRLIPRNWPRQFQLRPVVSFWSKPSSDSILCVCEKRRLWGDYTYLQIIVCVSLSNGTVLSAKSDSDVMFCLQSCQGLIIG